MTPFPLRRSVPTSSLPARGEWIEMPLELFAQSVAAMSLSALGEWIEINAWN